MPLLTSRCLGNPLCRIIANELYRRVRLRYCRSCGRKSSREQDWNNKIVVVGQAFPGVSLLLPAQLKGQALTLGPLLLDPLVPSLSGCSRSGRTRLVLAISFALYSSCFHPFLHGRPAFTFFRPTLPGCCRDHHLAAVHRSPFYTSSPKYLY